MIENTDISKFPKVEIDFNPKIPLLKKTPDKSKINIRYSLISPFAYAHIYWDPQKFEVFYNIEEPMLTEQEMKYKNEIISAMNEIINFEEVIEKNKDSLLDYLDKMFKVLAIELGMTMNYESYKKIFYYIARDFIGFNDIEPLLRDYFVEDIECNGTEFPVYVVHRIFRNLKTNLVYKSMDELEGFVEKLAQRSGKYISYSNPILDASLPDGSRINATYTKDITSRGPTFTIRKFTKTPWTPPQLLEFNTLSAEMMAYLWLLVEYGTNILIAGGTASGKTTLLNALAFFISPEDRVVSIEDTRELNLPRENWLPSVVRTATGVGGAGEIDLFTLLRSSFRQNPDYVIVGEVRGKEAYVLFQGMASGHPSIGTIHADSVDTVIKRLESPPIELSPTLLNILDCVCVMTHANVKGMETRKLREIVEIINVDDKGVALTNKPFMWNALEDTFYYRENNKIFEKIAIRNGLRTAELELEFRRRSELLRKMQEQRIFKFETVQDLINEYYKKPNEVLRRFGIR